MSTAIFTLIYFYPIFSILLQALLLRLTKIFRKRWFWYAKNNTVCDMMFSYIFFIAVAGTLVWYNRFDVWESFLSVEYARSRGLTTVSLVMTVCLSFSTWFTTMVPPFSAIYDILGLVRSDSSTPYIFAFPVPCRLLFNRLPDTHAVTLVRYHLLGMIILAMADAGGEPDDRLEVGQETCYEMEDTGIVVFAYPLKKRVVCGFPDSDIAIFYKSLVPPLENAKLSDLPTWVLDSLEDQAIRVLQGEIELMI